MLYALAFAAGYLVHKYGAARVKAWAVEFWNNFIGKKS
jgi:hypothetical protein